MITCTLCEQQKRPSRAMRTLCQECVDKVMAAPAIPEPGAEHVPSFGAGEFVAKVTKAIGIPQCGGCGQRRAAMNKVDLNGPAFSVFRGLVQAIIDPDPEDSDGGEKTVNQTEGESTAREESSSPQGVGKDVDGEVEK